MLFNNEMKIAPITLFVIILFGGFGAPRIFAQDRIWNGPATGDWFTAGNWIPNSNYPQAGENAIITNGSVLVNGDTAILNSLIINNAIVVCSNWTTRLQAMTVTVWSNGIITLPVAFSDSQMSNRIHIICTSLEVKTGGQIDANYKGYSGTAFSDGIGAGKGYKDGGGAGNGGRGGNTTPSFSYSDNGGSIMGNAVEPTAPGSSGGAGPNNPTFGGAGGGAIRIESGGGSVIVDGTINANGKAGDAWGINMRGGGGSGGSVWITCQTFGGGGMISANGGSSTVYNGGPEAGGGGGGRIAIHYTSLSGTPSAGISAAAGNGYYQFHTSREGWESEPGTVYLSDTNLFSRTISRLNGRFIISNLTSWTSGGLTISNSVFGFANGISLYVAGDLTVTTNAVLMNDTNCGISCTGAIHLEKGGRLALKSGLVCTGNLLADHSNSHVAIKGNVAAYLNGNVTLTNGAKGYFLSGTTNTTWTDHGLLVSVLGDVTIASNSWIYPVSHATNGGSCLFRMGNLTAFANSGFNADASGFGGVPGVGAYGPGRGIYRGGGAGYGGKGGMTSWIGTNGNPYGSFRVPVHPGSGGAGHDNAPVFSYGGGLVRIEVVKSVTIDGTITANGQAGYYFPSDMRSGCGSGGGIFIRCGEFSGNTGGVLRANGGTGAEFTGWSGGGGGGGRIAVWVGIPLSRYNDVATNGNLLSISITNKYAKYSGTLSVTNGIGYTNLPPGGAEPGSIFFAIYHQPPGMTAVVR